MTFSNFFSAGFSYFALEIVGNPGADHSEQTEHLQSVAPPLTSVFPVNETKSTHFLYCFVGTLPLKLLIKTI